MALTDEEQRALIYRQQCERRQEFQRFLAQKRRGSDYAYRQLCIKTKPVRTGEAGDTTNDQK